MRVFFFIFVCVLLLSSAGCDKLDYNYDAVYVWTGTIKSEDDFYQNSDGCVGAVSPCDRSGEARIRIAPNNIGGYNIYFFYNNRLVRKLVALRSESDSGGFVYYDESGKLALDCRFYFDSPWTAWIYTDAFPFGQDQSGQKYRNYFKRVYG